MGLDPITVTLTTFEKLETLRAEMKVREEELQAVERDLRGAMRSLAIHRYLKAISPFYSGMPPPPETATVAELEKRRLALYAVIQSLRAEIPRLESAVSSASAPPRTEARRNHFQ